jgi:alkylhydroperoxidase family enzyme
MRFRWAGPALRALMVGVLTAGVVLLPAPAGAQVCTQTDPVVRHHCELGGGTGFLGAPTTAVLTAPDGVGRFQYFQGGAIYWTPATGAHEVHGAILARWASMGWERSALGYPITDEYSVNAGRESDFQGGFLRWTAATGAVRTALLAPYDQSGTWVTRFRFSREFAGTNPPITPSTVDTMADAGVDTIYLQAAADDPRYPGLLSSDLLGQFLTRAHARGMQVVAWYLPHLTDVEADLARLRAMTDFRAAGQSFDAVAVDIEDLSVADVDVRNARLVDLSQPPGRGRPDRHPGCHRAAPGGHRRAQPRLLAAFPVAATRPGLPGVAADGVLEQPDGGVGLAGPPSVHQREHHPRARRPRRAVRRGVGDRRLRRGHPRRRLHGHGAGGHGPGGGRGVDLRLDHHPGCIVAAAARLRRPRLLSSAGPTSCSAWNDPERLSTPRMRTSGSVMTATRDRRDPATTRRPPPPTRMSIVLSQICLDRCLHAETTRRGGDMTSDTRVPRAAVTGVYGAVLTRVGRRMFGQVPEPLEVMWHNRPVLLFSLGLGRRSARWHQCDEQLKSLAHMAVASLVGCSWCLDLGYFQAHNEGLDEAKAREVPRWRTSEAFTPLERHVLEYAEAMSQTPPTVTDELSARLLEQLGAPALVELTASIALANQFTRTNSALGIEAQGFSASCGLPPLAPVARPSGVPSQP